MFREDTDIYISDTLYEIIEDLTGRKPTLEDILAVILGHYGPARRAKWAHVEITSENSCFVSLEAEAPEQFRYIDTYLGDKREKYYD